MDFEVRHADGTTVKLISSEHKCAITSATQTRKLCGNDTVTINLQSATYIDFYVGDKITIFGTTYTLNQLPTVKKESERSYSYTLVFEGLQYTLIDRVFLMPDNTQGDNLMFDLAGMLDVLDDNINRGNSGKQYEFVLDNSLEETEYKNLSLTGKNCLQVLQQLCQEWNTEFVFAEEANRIAIYIGVAGSTFPTTFKYGRGGGVYELNREKGASDICTRLFVYGGTQNLTYYRHNRLCLPSKEKNQSYVEDATAQAVYGIKEQVKNFDDIYPNRIGTITSLSGCDYNEFIDSDMADSQFGFDLNEKWANNADDCAEWLALKGLENTEANRTIYYNDVAGTATKYLMAQASAKIHFNTGALAGYECDLHSYTHSSQKFVLKPLVDENGYDFPSKTNAAFKLAVGDEYVILDINLPTAYKTQAESKLATEAASYFETVCRPQPKYTLTIEPIALKHIVGPSTADTEIFKVGDLINISDPTGGVESATIRIDQFVRNLLDPFDYKLTLTDEITYSQQVRTLIEVDAIKRVVEESKIYDVNRIRRGWKDAEELYNQMFDTEGHYYSEKIAPLSIDTQMLKVGARSQQLVLQNVLFQPNYNADPANLQISAGSLVHYTIAEPDIKTWTMSALSASNVPSTAQYVYAKCAKNGTTGTWLVTDEAIVFDSELYPNDYHFLVGSLSSVDSVSNTRNFAATYGFTTINGRNITTGVIKSADGNGVIIDLDNNTITGNIKFLSSGQAVDAEQYINNTVDAEVGALGVANRNLIGETSIDKRVPTSGTATSGYSAQKYPIYGLPFTNGETLTLQADITVHAGTVTACDIGFYDTSGNYLWNTRGQISGGKILLTFTANSAIAEISAMNLYFFAGAMGATNGNAITISHLKVERGDTKTDWSIAPEDVGVAVDTANAAKNAVDNLEIGGRNYAITTYGDKKIGYSETAYNQVTCTLVSSATALFNGTATTNGNMFGSTVKVFGGVTLKQGRYLIWVTQDNIGVRVGSGSSASYITEAPFGSTKDNPFVLDISNEQVYWFVFTTKGGITYSNTKVSLMIEQGTVATDWSPAPEDTDYLKTALAEATSGTTEIEGGLINTKMIQAGSGSSQAGMVGLESLMTAFFAGGSVADAENMVAPVVIKRDGFAKFGVLFFDPSGIITMKDTTASKTTHLVIKNGEVPAPQAQDIEYNNSNNTPTNIIYSSFTAAGTNSQANTRQQVWSAPLKTGISNKHNGMNVLVNGGTATYTITGGVGVQVYAEVYFRVTGTERLVAMVVANLGSSGSASGTVTIPSQSLTFNASGSTGAIDALMYVTASASGCQVSVGSVQYGWYHDCTSLQTTLADNGLAVIKDNQNFFRAIAGSSGMTTTIKGNTDIPGVLWAGRIESGGGKSTYYKNSAKFATDLSVSKSSNSYTITHNLGTTNYAVQITPYSNVTFSITKATNGNSFTVSLSTAANFDLTIFGTN